MKSTMKVTLYQVNIDRDTNRVAFLNYDALPRFQGTNKIDSGIYDKVYEGEISAGDLEGVFTMFNCDRPEDYAARSMSVSDVVKIEGSVNVKDGFYFCDSDGFKEVGFQEEKTQEKAPEGKISVLLIQPDHYPKKIEIEDSLEAMQDIVGGSIEEYMPFVDEVAIICNEEGKINGSPLNRAVYDENHNMVDIVAGDFFIAYAPSECDRFLTLPKNLEEKYQKKFQYPERFVMTDEGISAIPFRPKCEEKER